jgi:hypothetical protein
MIDDEQLIVFIKEYQDQLTSIDLAKIINRVSEERRIDLIKEYHSQLGSFLLERLISKVSEERRIDLIKEYQSQLGSISLESLLNGLSEERRIDLIKECQSQLGSISLESLINKVNEERRIDLIKECQSQLDSFSLGRLINKVSEERRIDLIKECQSQLGSIYLAAIINGVSEERRIDLIKECQSQLGSIYLAAIINGVSEERRIDLIKECQSQLDSALLAEIINRVSEERRIDLIKECQSQLDSASLAEIINGVREERRIDLIKEYQSQLDSASLAEIINGVSEERRLGLIKDYIDKLNDGDVLKLTYNNFKEFFYNFLFEKLDSGNIKYTPAEINKLLDYLLPINDEILGTLNLSMLDENNLTLFRKIDSKGNVSYPSLRMVGKYKDIQEQIIILNSDENIKKLFSMIYTTITSMDIDYTLLLERTLNGLIDNKILFNESFCNYFEQLSENDKRKWIDSIIFATSKKIKFNSIEEIVNCHRMIDENYTNLISNGNASSAEDAKRAIFLKRYGLTLEEVASLISRYATNLETQDLKLSVSDKKTIEILRQIKKLYLTDDLDQLLLIENLMVKPTKTVDYGYVSSFEAQARLLYAHQLKASLLKVGDLSEVDYVPVRCRQKVYRVFDMRKPLGEEQQFNILLHNLGAYSGFVRPENYRENWLIPKDESHNFCSSLISNEMMGVARCSFASLGFSDFPASSFMLQAPFDIVSGDANKSFSSVSAIDDSRVQYLFPKDMIDYTRHTHNEICIDRVTTEGKKLEPSYVIFMAEEYDPEKIKKWEHMSEEEVKLLSSKEQEDYGRWDNAVQASNDFGVPIVVIERKKIRQNELKILDNMFEEFKTTHDPELIRNIFLRFENNRAGCRGYWVSDGFNPGDAEKLITDTLDVLDSMPSQNRKECIDSLISWIDWECSDKQAWKGSSVGVNELGFDPVEFRTSLEALRTTKTNDFSLSDILSSGTLSKISTGYIPFSQQIELLKSELFRKEADYFKIAGQKSLSEISEKVSLFTEVLDYSIKDEKRREAYQGFDSKIHSDRHIEDVILFTLLVGDDKFKGQNKSEMLKLAVEASKYHDCGRSNDNNSEHALDGALKSYDILSKTTDYSPLELAIIYTSIYCHEFKGKDCKDVNQFNEQLRRCSDEVFRRALVNISNGNLPDSDVEYTMEEYNAIMKSQCDSSGLSEETILDDVSQIVTTVRDADALDRTRFISSSKSFLNPEYLSAEASRYVDFSLQLAELHSCMDLSQMVKDGSIDMETLESAYNDTNSVVAGTSYQVSNPKELLRFVRKEVLTSSDKGRSR